MQNDIDRQDTQTNDDEAATESGLERDAETYQQLEEASGSDNIREGRVHGTLHGGRSSQGQAEGG